MDPDWNILSRTSDLFESPDNPAQRLIKVTEKAMNSNTVLLKGEADDSILKQSPGYPRLYRDFFYTFIKDNFHSMFLEYDRLSKRDDYHEWHDTPEAEEDFYAGYVPGISNLVVPGAYFKLRPMSYLGFAERLHWMVRTSQGYYNDDHLGEDDTLQLVQAVSAYFFGEIPWKVGDMPHLWQGMPHWIDHPWSFYDIVPDFLKTTGYFENNEELRYEAYFDGGPNDSCTFFFHDTIFYILLTNGSP